MEKPNGVTVNIDAYRLEQFVRTGHPRTIGIALRVVRNDDELFEGVSIQAITINGERVRWRMTNAEILSV